MTARGVQPGPPLPKAAGRPCACHGVIVAPIDAPGPDVLAHNRTTQHLAWRMGYRVETLSGLPTMTPDGLPIVRLERVG